MPPNADSTLGAALGHRFDPVGWWLCDFCVGVVELVHRVHRIFPFTFQFDCHRIVIPLSQAGIEPARNGIV
ncbi:hypothetical protein EB810_12745 [Altererythrobacter sp. FM1]|nr:hypothetical protein EB810_12745 [Altererythrobacter sp. FM1]